MKKATTALLMAGTASAFGLTAEAGAAGWGPRTSSYNGQVRVEGGGTLERRDGGSWSRVRVKDRMPNDGNDVYGYTEWFRIQERCSSFGVQLAIVGSSSSQCRIDAKRHARLSTPEITGERTYEKLANWCDQDGKHCADYGLKVVAGACAQMGFPIPDSCTYAYVEFHRP